MTQNKHVRAKKHLGQHFLKSTKVAKRISDSLTFPNNYKQLIEIGPGKGILTDHLWHYHDIETILMEVDEASIQYLNEKYPEHSANIRNQDFLNVDLDAADFQSKLGIIGNFPYNISSQIFFKVLEHHNQVDEVVGMVQKEVGERLASPPGNKNYGILSVLLQAYYNIEYLFTVEPSFFHPPPKVRSAVIRLTRNSVNNLDCDEVLFKKLVKQAFQTRRKTLRNALKAINFPADSKAEPYMHKRAEQLDVNEFVILTKIWEAWKNR